MSFQQLSGPPSTSGSSSKVPIPRLDRRGEPPHRPGKSRDRVQRACLTCRARKVKCNGGFPKCANCDENQAPCVYVSSRKDKLKTLVLSWLRVGTYSRLTAYRATEQNQDMIRLLRDLREHSGGADRKKIEDMLSSVCCSDYLFWTKFAPLTFARFQKTLGITLQHKYYPRSQIQMTPRMNEAKRTFLLKWAQTET